MRGNPRTLAHAAAAPNGYPVTAQANFLLPRGEPNYVGKITRDKRFLVNCTRVVWTVVVTSNSLALQYICLPPWTTKSVAFL